MEHKCVFNFICLCFMAYQHLWVILRQILFVHIYSMYMICKHILLIIFVNELELFFCTQLKGFKYFYLIRIILKLIKEFQVLLLSTYNSIQHYSFVFTQLNGSKYSKTYSRKLRLVPHQMVSCHTHYIRWVGVLPPDRDAVGVFHSPSRLGCVWKCWEMELMS